MFKLVKGAKYIGLYKMCKNILVVISSKNPTQILIDNINNLYSIQMTDGNKYKIICVDSDSTNFETYELINQRFQSVIEIIYAKNKNYEDGAYKHADNKYPNYNIYICMQDTFIITKQIDMCDVNDSYCFSCYHKSGYLSDPNTKHIGITQLYNTGLEYKQIIDTPFNLAQHCSFVVSKSVMNDIFNTLINPPTDKLGSCSYERVFGLYFILKQIKTIDLNGYHTKIHGLRR